MFIVKMTIDNDESIDVHYMLIHQKEKYAKIVKDTIRNFYNLDPEFSTLEFMTLGDFLESIEINSERHYDLGKIIYQNIDREKTKEE